jgi:hypothetical protein
VLPRSASGNRAGLTLCLPLLVYPDQRTSSDRLGWSGSCQKQTKKAATFDAVWRFSEHHTHPYVSGFDMKNLRPLGAP